MLSEESNTQPTGHAQSFGFLPPFLVETLAPGGSLFDFGVIRDSAVLSLVQSFVIPACRVAVFQMHMTMLR